MLQDIIKNNVCARTAVSGAMPGMSEGKGEFSDLGKREQPIKKEFSSHVELSNCWRALLSASGLLYLSRTAKLEV